VQLDFYGPESAVWAVRASAYLRDDYGCDMLAPDCQPLHADTPRMGPFVSGEEQYEQRWFLTAAIQWNAVMTLPQQFAGAAEVELVEVDVEYPVT
jgi:hypothetical protein